MLLPNSFGCTEPTTSAEVISRLQTQSHIFSSLRRIISDRGTAFTSKEFQNYCREQVIEHTLITTGIPRTNNLVERVNNILIPLLTKLSAPKSCKCYLDAVQRCLNTTPHRSTGTTPFRLLFGVNARLPDNLQLRKLLNDELVFSFDSEREELRRQARKSIQRIQSENKRNFGKGRKKAFQYREGDIVAICRTPQASGSKLAHNFLGPYEVTKTLRNDRYVVRWIGQCEEPKQMISAADFMKSWTSDNCEALFRNDEEDENDEQSG